MGLIKIQGESLKDRYAARAKLPIVLGGGDPTRHPAADPM